VLGREDLELARAAFPNATTVCPPYLAYDARTYGAMEALGLRAIFGGLHGEHHHHGEAPAYVGGGVTHYSATTGLYLHSYRMAETVRDIADSGYPLVVNIHHRWDAVSLDGVGRLREALAGRVVAVDEVRSP
jgi:peptidoglycan/xylan/chitin deacetylase (PgdA/CDA1 family)